MNRFKKLGLSGALIIVIICLLYIIPYFDISHPELIEISPSNIMQQVKFNKDNSIVLKGKNLTDIESIYINGDEYKAFESVGSDELKFTLDESYYKNPGKIKVYVKKNRENIAIKKSNTITIEVLSKDSINKPIINNISPNKVITKDGFNDSKFIFIEGENFDENSKVIINGKVIETTILEDSNTLKAQIPYKQWALADEIKVQVKQFYNEYSTGISSNTITVPLEHNQIQTEVDNSWVKENFLVAHALGGIDGRTYTNSRQAFEYNYSVEQRIFEVDLTFTSDDVLIARHYWDASTYTDAMQEVPDHMKNNLPQTYEELKASDTQYDMLNFKEICQIMSEYKDIYIMTDTKEKTPEAIEKAFKAIVDIAQKVDATILDRLIVQIYDRAMYTQVMNVYPFKSIVYTLYNSSDTEDEVIEFVKQTGIDVITMPESKVNQGFVENLNKQGCYVFVHTINNMKKVEQYREMGVYGFYTDTIIYDYFGLQTKSEYYEMFHKQFSKETAFIQGDETLLEYLDLIDREDLIVLLSIKDDGSSALTQEILKKMQGMGVINLEGQYRKSYVGVIDNNKVLKQEISDEKLNLSLEIDGVVVDIVSAGLDAGNMSSIRINDREYGMNERGLNIVVYDKITQKVIDSVTFDTHNGLGSTRKPIEEDYYKYLNEYLKDINNDNYINIITIKDEGTSALDETIVNNLKALGLKADLIGKYRWSYVAITDGGSVVQEELSEELIEVKKEVQGNVIQAISGGLNAGDYTSIRVNGKEFAKNERGLNIVTYDKTLGKVINSISFDTCEGYRYSKE